MKTFRWHVFGCVFVSGIVIAMNQFKIPPVMNTLMETLQIDRTQGGLLMTGYALAVAVLLLPSAVIFDRLGERKTVVLALALSIAGSLTGAIAQSFAVLMVSRCIEGCASALIAVVLPAVPVRYFPPGEQGKPMGIQAGFISAAVLIIFNLSALLERITGGIQSIWLFTAALSLLCLLVSMFLIRDSHVKENRRTDGWRKAIHNPLVWILAGGFLGIGFRDLSYSTWAADFFQQARGLGQAYANLSTSLSYAGLWTGSLVSGLLADRQIGGVKMLLSSGGGLLVLGIGCFTIPNILILPYMFATGLFLGLGVSSTYLLAAEGSDSGREATYATAVINLFLYVGHLSSPVLSGAVIDRYGWFADTYVIGAGSLLVLLCGLLLIKNKKTYR